MTTDLMQTELQLIIELLLIASIVAIAVKYIKLPYTVALIMVGLVLSFARLFNVHLIPGSGEFHLTKDLVFLIFLPPLLFEGAINMDLEILRRNKLFVALLAFVGTLVTCVLFGISLNLAFGFSLIPALLMGSILAPTDPVSVLALFKENGVDKDLSIIVEGESVFNDGLGVVLFLILLEAIETDKISFFSSFTTFIWEVGVAGFVGLTVGFIVHNILGRIDDHLTEVTISLVLAYGVYIIADAIHASGVIAVVCAGLIMGNYGRVLSMSPTTRLTLTSFWEVAAFLANSLLFLLIGIEFDPRDLQTNWKLVLILFFFLLIFRSFVVYGIFGLVHLFKRVPPLKWLHVVNWGGLRGSIPIALALGLPTDITLKMADTVLNRREIIAIVFGVVLLSLLVQGLSIKSLLNFLKLTGLSEAALKYERMLGKIIATKSALEVLRHLFDRGEVTDLTHEKLENKLKREKNFIVSDMKEFLAEHGEVHDAEFQTISRTILLSQRAAIQESFHRGLLSEHVASELIRFIDVKITDSHASPNQTGAEYWSGFLLTEEENSDEK
ncbi:Na+/H+ antiporter [candidate division CSSED10-310 bacterium]|uniref:Na+/H+ antiporter n=1 Tax=candidate division CSSED10-310 bacterium TaxID=2855610 RepID=A0ABV6YXE2_UNCC1